MKKGKKAKIGLEEKEGKLLFSYHILPILASF